MCVTLGITLITCWKKQAIYSWFGCKHRLSNPVFSAISIQTYSGDDHFQFRLASFRCDAGVKGFGFYIDLSYHIFIVFDKPSNLRFVLYLSGRTTAKDQSCTMPSPSPTKSRSSLTLPALVPSPNKERSFASPSNDSQGRRRSIPYNKSPGKNTSLSNLVRLRGLARAGKKASGSNVLEAGSRLSRRNISTRGSYQESFHPNFDDTEAPSIRFIYSEAVVKALKRIGVSLSRAKLLASTEQQCNLDTTDGSLELAFLDEIKTGVAERIQLRQLHPSRYARRGHTQRLNAGSRQATARLSALQTKFQPIVSTFGVMPGRRKTGATPLPPIAHAVAEEEEEEDVEQKPLPTVMDAAIEWYKARNTRIKLK